MADPTDTPASNTSSASPAVSAIAADPVDVNDHATIHQTYWTRGFVVVNDVFAPEQVDAVTAESMRVSQELLSSGDPKTAHRVAVDAGDDGQMAPRKIDHPFWRSDIFMDYVMHPKLRAIIRMLLDDEPRLCTDQIFMKPPRFGSAKPYHQDNGYFLVHPSDKVITAWLAFDDVDESNGCLRYIESSHLGDIYQHKPIVGEAHNMSPDAEHIDLSKERLAVVRRGGVVFHHSKTLHTSHRNESDRWRRAYATHWVGSDVTCDAETLKTAYFEDPRYPHDR